MSAKKAIYVLRRDEVRIPAGTVATRLKSGYFQFVSGTAKLSVSATHINTYAEKR